MSYQRKYPVGAEVLEKGVHFRVWAPTQKKVDLFLQDDNVLLPMKKEKNGHFSVMASQAKEGTLYSFTLGKNNHCADPASRYQPFGPEGPSCVVNPEFDWTDRDWKGVTPYNHIAYELHVGTFTEAGTYQEAAKQIPFLSDLGITLIEIMPLAEFPGHFGWGYDGVNLFAPSHLYGEPHDLKKFIDKAHKYGIGVILDVVYNHLGPEGNTLLNFSKDYVSRKYTTNWGKAVNFDLLPSREFFLTNAKYWIQEYHFDGLRIDATPCFFSSTPKHILAELAEVIKKAGGRRKTIVIGENESQNTQLLSCYKDGYGFDMLWNDDFHHTALVRLRGKREAYYTDYLGSPQEFVSAVKYGYLYQGQYYQWQQKNRGLPFFKIPHYSMMIFLENHDQVANSGYGTRLYLQADSGNYKALTALFLLSPNTPLIFQGQEFNSSKPFYYFADHSPELSTLVKKGRKKELSQFPRLKIPEVQKVLPDPGNPLTFMRSKLDHSERDKNHLFLQFFKDLIKLKKTDPVLSAKKIKIDGAVLSQDAFVIRYFDGKQGDRLLIVNFGPDLFLNPSPEPLLAPEPNSEFKILFSTESLAYGGEGIPPILIPHLKVLGHSAILLQLTRRDERDNNEKYIK